MKLTDEHIEKLSLGRQPSANSPRRIGFHTEAPPQLESLANTKITRGGKSSSFELPRSLLGCAFKFDQQRMPATERLEQNLKFSMPSDFVIAVKQIVEMMILQGNSQFESVAEACGLSPRTLQRRLTELVSNYRQLANDLRVAIAAKWLKTTELNLHEIAYNLGYSDPSNFTRAFRQQTGASPQEFRHQG